MINLNFSGVFSGLRAALESNAIVRCTQLHRSILREVTVLSVIALFQHV